VTFVFAAVEQADHAGLDWDGVTYRCTTWRRVARSRVEAIITVKQPDGQNVIYDQSVLIDLSDDEDNEDGSYPDLPRVIARGKYFIAHWVEPDGAESSGIRRKIFDVTDHAAGWVDMGKSLALNPQSRLYDVDVLEGHADDFVMAWHSGTSLVVGRWEPPYAWSDSDWQASNTVQPGGADPTGFQPRVLTVAGSVTDGDVVVAWQKRVVNAHNVWCSRVNASDGGGYAEAIIFDDLAASLNYGPTGAACTNVGLVRISTPSVARSWAIVAEILGASAAAGGSDGRDVAYCRVSGANAARTSFARHVRGLHLGSRPWTWRKPLTLALGDPGLDVHVLLTFKQVAAAVDGPPDEWAQQYAYVVSLDHESWGVDGFVAPIVVSAIMRTLPDGRPAGDAPQRAGRINFDYLDQDPPEHVRLSFRRSSHLSHVAGPPVYPLGPDRKTVSFAFAGWDRLTVGAAAKMSKVTNAEEKHPVMIPAMASIRQYEHYHQDPWQNVRDPQDPKEPAAALEANYKGAHHRPIALPVEIPGALVFCGGTTQVYSGAQLVELGYLWQPYIQGVSSSSAHQDAREYWYTYTWVWPDEKGQLHRSPPATPVKRLVNNIPDGSEPPGWDVWTDTTVLNVRTMNMSMKDHPRYYPGASPISIELWRTYYPGPDLDQGGADQLPGDAHDEIDPITGQPAAIFVFRRVFTYNLDGPMQLNDTPENDRRRAFQDIFDDQPDRNVARAEILPWQLNLATLQWTPPAPMPHVPLYVAAVWQNRLWGVSPDDPRVVLYSNEMIPEQGLHSPLPEFIPEGEFRIDQHGEVTAMIAMDNALIVFTRDAVLELTGEGVTFAGTDPSLHLSVIATGTGCIEPRSIVYGPPGVFFQSAKGYYLLTRGHELDYISAGAAIEDLLRESGNVRGAVLLEDRHQIRLTLNALPGENAADVNPRIAIYDYFHRLWSVRVPPELALITRHTGHQGSTWWRGREGETCHVILQDSGLAVERAASAANYSDTGHDDAEIPIPIDVTVEWIHVAGIAGFKKLHEIGIQMERISGVSSAITVQVWYDLNGRYDDSIAPHDTFSVTNAEGYIRIRPSIRKCSAFLMRVFESGTVPKTANIKITGLAMKVGIKKRPRTVPDTQVGV
jgi:hypothetical protein